MLFFVSSRSQVEQTQTETEEEKIGVIIIGIILSHVDLHCANEIFLVPLPRKKDICMRAHTKFCNPLAPVFEQPFSERLPAVPRWDISELPSGPKKRFVCPIAQLSTWLMICICIYIYIYIYNLICFSQQRRELERTQSRNITLNTKTHFLLPTTMSAMRRQSSMLPPQGKNFWLLGGSK